MLDKEEKFRAEQTHKFIEQHGDADLIEMNAKTKEPVRAIYINKTSKAYQDEEANAFFARIALEQLSE